MSEPRCYFCKQLITSNAQRITEAYAHPECAFRVQCYYCFQLIREGDDAQRIERRKFAHTECAWTIEDAFWQAWDKEEGKG